LRSLLHDFFPRASLLDELVVVGEVVVEAEVAIAMALEGCREGLGAVRSGALHACGRQPAHADARARIAHLGATFGEIGTQAGDRLVMCMRIGKGQTLFPQRLDVVLLDALEVAQGALH